MPICEDNGDMYGEEVLLLVTHGSSLACDGRVACPSRFSFAIFSYLVRTVQGC
jgi:hypothetical protein